MAITQGPRHMYQRLVPKWRLWKLSEPEKYGTGFVGMLKNAYGEQPSVCFCACLALIGVAKLVWNYNENEKNGTLTNLPYKKYYTVYRPEDERLLKLRSEWFENGVPPTTKTDMSRF